MLTKKVINYNVIAVMSNLGHMTSLRGIMTKVLQFSVEADQYSVIKYVEDLI